MTIAKRLLILAIVPLVALLCLGAYTWLKLTQIETSNRFISHFQIPSLAVLGNISRKAEDLRVTLRDYLLATDPAQRAAFRAAREQKVREMRELLLRYENSLISSEEDRRIFSEFRSITDEMIVNAEPMMALVDAGRREEALALLRNGASGTVGERLIKVTSRWIELNDNLAVDAGEKVLRAIEDSRRNLLIANASALLLTGLLGFLTYRRIARPIQALDASVKAIAAGNYAQVVPFTDATDETGSLARSIESGRAAQLYRLSRLKGFFSPEIAESIVSGEGEDLLKTHRREVVVVFLDLRGFTAFTDRSEPEEVMAVLGEYHLVMGQLIMAHKGTLERFAGDGLMIFFNDPVKLENPTANAVRMALEMQEKFKLLRAAWLKRGYDLDLGIGIAQGYATLGAIGFEGRRDYACIGSVTNLAARLCSEAKGGQIVINQKTLARVEETIRAEPLGEFALKGLARPVQAFNVTGFGAAAPA